ncbi:MAG: hypothetical protein K0S80_601 [Neobacillus sp.]|nr:hypothetical protein [Neobacillus sp.]
MFDLKGIIDLHIHSAPDIRSRTHDDFELAEQAIEIGARAIVIKSHHSSTAERAWLVNKLYPNVDVFGSITLNRSVGGINPYAVDYALKMGAKTVWLPTIDACNHRQKEGKDCGIDIVMNQKVLPELREVFKLIAEKNVTLATGHLSPKEIYMVIKEARNLGVQKIVITHPEFHIVGMTISEQKELRNEFPVYFERTYAQPIGNGKYRSNLQTNLESIIELGYESTIISTDSGQIQNPLWKIAISEYIQFLNNHGIPDNELEVMTKTAPAFLLDLL